LNALCCSNSGQEDCAQQDSELVETLVNRFLKWVVNNIHCVDVWLAARVLPLAVGFLVVTEKVVPVVELFFDLATELVAEEHLEKQEPPQWGQ